MDDQEIITLQFGNYSNFVGTHFWNLKSNSFGKDEDKNVCQLFRETSHQQFVPRMISFDEKQSLRALKLDGTFQPPDKKNPNLENNCVTYEQGRDERTVAPSHLELHETFNPDQEREENIKTWSDYMTYSLNENSLQLLRNRFSEKSSFTYHGLGVEEYEHIKYDVDDKLHYWAEECDSLEGFMIFSDMHDGFCGLTTKMLEELQEDYGRKSFLTFINWPVLENSSDILYYLNTALSFQSFKENSSIFVLQSLQDELFSKKSKPIFIPNTAYHPLDLYHTSSFLASAISSSILPWSQLQEASMADISHHLSQDRWKLVGNAIGFPLAKDEAYEVSLFDKMPSIESLYGPFVSSLFPISNINTVTPMSQSVVFQDRFNLVTPAFQPTLLQSLGLTNGVCYGNPLRVADYFIQKWYPSNTTTSKIFYNKSNQNFSSPLPDLIIPPGKTEVTSSLFTSGIFHDLLLKVINRIKNIKLGKFNFLEHLNFNEDLREELLEDLQNLAQEYDLKEVMEVYE